MLASLVADAVGWAYCEACAKGPMEKNMPGALLRSGEAREFQALGADGQPVYSAALPLRETIRLKLGTDAANCLALVKKRWYYITNDMHNI